VLTEGADQLLGGDELIAERPLDELETAGDADNAMLGVNNEKTAIT